MYISPIDVSSFRSQAIENYTTHTNSYLDSVERFQKMYFSFIKASLDTTKSCAKHINDDLNNGDSLGFFSSATLSAHKPFLVVAEETGEWVSDAYLEVTKSIRSSSKLIDELAYKVINRASRAMPWEGNLVLDSVKSALHGVDNSVDEVTIAVSHAVENIEAKSKEVVHELTSVAPKSTAKGRRAA